MLTGNMAIFLVCILFLLVWKNTADIEGSIIEKLSQQFAEDGLKAIHEKETLETHLESLNLVADDALTRFRKPSDKASAIGRAAQARIFASKALIKTLNLGKDEAAEVLSKFSLRNTVLGRSCDSGVLPHEEERFRGLMAVEPRARIYRNMDGSDNNQANPSWGTPTSVYRRLLASDYADGVSTVRTSVTGGSLPSARFVSSTVVKTTDVPYDDYSLMLMQWGQFLDHDITFTPVTQTTSGTGIACCKGGEAISSSTAHPDCLPITINSDDPFYSKYKISCMNFVRSVCGLSSGCTLSASEQMNGITAFIDGSNVYGSSKKRSTSLRSFSGGKLTMSNTDDHPLLPVDTSTGSCTDTTASINCYMAGDLRVNVQADLATMQTIWAREHNRIASELASINPSWDDETLFQETRRIVISEMQHITYGEFLPLILGATVMSDAGLTPTASGFQTLYNSSLDPTISNEFATAAYRFGHSLIDGTVNSYNSAGVVQASYLLHDISNNPSVITVKDQFLGLVRGLSRQPSRQSDPLFTSEIHNQLFQTNGKFGADLVSLNIQRGRDHGIPPYYKYRELCNVEGTNSFDGLTNIPTDTVNSLSTAYNGVFEDIDLYIGGISEDPYKDGVVGRVFNCILLDTFSRLRKGDRYFYEEDSSVGFKEDQLAQIKKITLSRVICDNTDVGSYTEAAFFQPTTTNPIKDCAEIDAMSLDPWKV